MITYKRGHAPDLRKLQHTKPDDKTRQYTTADCRNNVLAALVTQAVPKKGRILLLDGSIPRTTIAIQRVAPEITVVSANMDPDTVLIHRTFGIAAIHTSTVMQYQRDRTGDAMAAANYMASQGDTYEAYYFDNWGTFTDAQARVLTTLATLATTRLIAITFCTRNGLGRAPATPKGYYIAHNGHRGNMKWVYFVRSTCA